MADPSPLSDAAAGGKARGVPGMAATDQKLSKQECGGIGSAKKWGHETVQSAEEDSKIPGPVLFERSGDEGEYQQFPLSLGLPSMC
jgi:hypothetical protein